MEHILSNEITLEQMQELLLAKKAIKFVIPPLADELKTDNLESSPICELYLCDNSLFVSNNIGELDKPSTILNRVTNFKLMKDNKNEHNCDLHFQYLTNKNLTKFNSSIEMDRKSADKVLDYLESNKIKLDTMLTEQLPKQKPKNITKPTNSGTDSVLSNPEIIHQTNVTQNTTIIDIPKIKRLDATTEIQPALKNISISNTINTVDESKFGSDIEINTNIKSTQPNIEPELQVPPELTPIFEKIVPDEEIFDTPEEIKQRKSFDSNKVNNTTEKSDTNTVENTNIKQATTTQSPQEEATNNITAPDNEEAQQEQTEAPLSLLEQEELYNKQKALKALENYVPPKKQPMGLWKGGLKDTTTLITKCLGGYLLIAGFLGAMGPFALPALAIGLALTAYNGEVLGFAEKIVKGIAGFISNRRTKKAENKLALQKHYATADFDKKGQLISDLERMKLTGQKLTREQKKEYKAEKKEAREARKHRWNLHKEYLKNANDADKHSENALLGIDSSVKSYVDKGNVTKTTGKGGLSMLTGMPKKVATNDTSTPVFHNFSDDLIEDETKKKNMKMVQEKIIQHNKELAKKAEEAKKLKEAEESKKLKETEETKKEDTKKEVVTKSIVPTVRQLPHSMKVNTIKRKPININKKDKGMEL